MQRRTRAHSWVCGMASENEGPLVSRRRHVATRANGYSRQHAKSQAILRTARYVGRGVLGREPKRPYAAHSWSTRSRACRDVHLAATLAARALSESHVGGNAPRSWALRGP